MPEDLKKMPKEGLYMTMLKKVNFSYLRSASMQWAAVSTYHLLIIEAPQV